MGRVAHYRKGTADENAMRETAAYFRLLEEHGLSVDGLAILDAGAHIGTFTREALDRGAHRVVCYEPHPENFVLLEKNCPDAELHKTALVSDDRLTTPLMIGKAHNPLVGTERFSTARSLKNGNKVVAEVACCDFKDAIGDGIDAIKFDAEGAEYELFNAVDMPDRIKWIVGEFDCGGSFRLPDGSMTGKVSETANYVPLWQLIERIIRQGFSYYGPKLRSFTWPDKDVRLIHFLFVRRQ